MRKSLLTLLILSGIVFQFGCSSSKDKEAKESGDVAAEDAAAAEESPEDGTGDDEVLADTGEDDGTGELPEQPVGDSSAETTPAPTPAQDLFGTDNTASPPPVETTAAAESAPKSALPLLKVKTEPYQKSGRVLNTVYVAREGDTLEGVSQKVYGEDKAKQLVKDNPMLKRGVRTGDKIYYTSPKRPDDSTMMLTYYEDNGIQPKSYVTQKGDNIKTLAETLLGSKSHWKELWATNQNVESKGELDEGIELKYWPQDAMAATEPPPAEVAQNAPPTESALPAEPPPGPVAQATQPSSGTGTVEPPPPPAEMAPPPPPPVETPKKKSSKAAAMDKDTTFAMGVAGVILLCVFALIVIFRKNRSKRVNLGQTQV